MAFTEQVVIDKIEITENGIVQVREVTRVLRDNVQIAETYHRWSLVPGQDISDQPLNVQAICSAVWTATVVSEFIASQAGN